MRRQTCLGVLGFTSSDLEASLAKGERLRISVVGMLTLSQDVTPELADKAIESVFVRGSMQASSQVKDILADRMH